AKLISDQAELRLGLSATPIYNYGDEFYNIIEILRPDSLGTATEFAREWCSHEKRINDPKAFGMFLRDEGLMLRRTRADVNRELPPVQIIPQYVESDPKVLDQIKGKAM
ncbi:SNF2-related protein, partial [Acinetobacter baumannii]